MASDKLTYKQKRDFKVTKEPSGAGKLSLFQSTSLRHSET